jgi:hypothetical protein
MIFLNFFRKGCVRKKHFCSKYCDAYSRCMGERGSADVLRRYATSWKVAGSSLNEIIEFFQFT